MTARFAGEDEAQFLEDGYESADTEVGKVFYRPAEFKMGDAPEIRMVDFWGTKGIRAKDIESI